MVIERQRVRVREKVGEMNEAHQTNVFHENNNNNI